MEDMGRSASIHLLFLVVPFLATAQDLKEFEKHVTEFTLGNGLHFIVLERHEAPVVSFHTYVNAGSVDDPEGKTGLAHMFEHMAFKGTETIGTKDWPEKAMDAIGQLTTGSSRETQRAARRPESDPVAPDRGQSRRRKTFSYVVPNPTPRSRRERRCRLNASHLWIDRIFHNLPASRIELWFVPSPRAFAPVTAISTKSEMS
jgi:hypothetical protein